MRPRFALFDGFPKGIGDYSKGCCVLSPAGIVEIISRKTRRPFVEDLHERTLGQGFFDQIFGNIGNTKALPLLWRW